MSTKITDEAVASEILFDKFQNSNKSMVYSWHPPDSKAYFTKLLYIPKNGKRSHVDLIIQVGLILYLIEVKDSLANSYGDVEKLQSILNDFNTSMLIQIFRTQGLMVNPIPIVTKIVIVARNNDNSFVINHPNIAILLADNGEVRAMNNCGSELLRTAGLLKN